MRAALALIAVIILFAEPARSQVVHQISFEIAPVVEVWQTEAAAPGTAHFAVATNTGFEIVATRGDGGSVSSGDLAAAGFTLALAARGVHATDSGVFITEDAPGGVIVYRSPDRTAALQGTPESQALSFVAAWSADRLAHNLRFNIFPVAAPPAG